MSYSASLISASLVVEEGAHRAARVSLEPGRVQVGPGAECDIIITDMEPAGSFVLEVSDNTIKIGSCKQALSVEKAGDLRPGQSLLCGNGTRFSSGGISFRVEAPEAKRAFARIGSVRLVSAVVGAAACIVGTAALVAHMGPRSGPRSPMAAVVRSPTADLQSTGSVGARPSSISLSDRSARLLQEFRKHLVSKGLDSVVLKANPEGAIEASGQIPVQQGDIWREASRRFDALDGGPLVLVDRVTLVTEAAPLTVRAVWPGELAYVVDGSGEKLFVGSVLPTGWTISGIDAKRVQMRRGDQVLAVRF